MTLTVLRSTNWVFCKISLSWDLSDVLLMITLGLWVSGEEDHRGNMPFLQCHYQHDVPQVDVDLEHLVEVAFARFLHCKIAPLFLFSILYSLERSPYVCPTLKELGVTIHLL